MGCSPLPEYACLLPAEGGLWENHTHEKSGIDEVLNLKIYRLIYFE